VLDLGPGGGVNGGEIVTEGTPEKVAAEPRSFTGQYLKPLLSRFAPPVAASEPVRPKRKSTAKAALENAK